MKEKVTRKQVYHKEKGQSLVELALTLLIILTLLAGTVDLGMAFFSYVALRDAAQEGALYGSLYPTDTNGIISRVRQSSSAPVNLSDISKVTISSSTPQGACRNNPITVTVSYNYQLSMPFIGPILGANTIPLSAAVTDTILNPKCP
ncbi:MAG: pilus assembly protein [Chloroflexi bacterium]|nr:pilus assembly protein [Chloroflexota bacterium]